MPKEPEVKRAMAYFDGQNLFHAAKYAFGHTWPSYDPLLLARAVCVRMGWRLMGVRFYTGLPSAEDNPFWHGFWSNKLAAMGRAGVVNVTRRLKYRNQLIELPGGGTETALVGQEKGVDVRIALDLVRHARRGESDVLLVFSQDQDLAEAADEVREISMEQDRWIKIASAYPASPEYANKQGIDKTDWIPLSREEYAACLDHNDYRPKA
ncbi:NYN domain-containing protein [Desulfocurvus sp. DL9XJH121]